MVTTEPALAFTFAFALLPADGYFITTKAVYDCLSDSPVIRSSRPAQRQLHD